MRIYAYIAALFAILAAFYGTYHAGQVSERDKQHQAVIDFQKREADLLVQLNAARKARQVITNERIKVVEKAVDECIDRRLPADLLDSLQHDLPPG